MALPGLFVGRFQPFHLGHLDALNQALSRENSLVIAIGSAQDNITLENPFTTRQRMNMIRMAIPNKKIKIIPVPDIGDDTKWVKHVESLVPRFSTVYTGSPIIKKLFEAAGYKIHTIKMNLKISATEIRSRMRKGENFDNLVPEKVATFLKKIQL